MNSDLAKVLHPLRGRPLITYSVDLARYIGSEFIVIVVGHQADAVREAVQGEGIVFADQVPQLGTAHAVLQARGALEHFEGTTVILCGDVPLLQPEAVEHLLKEHHARRAALTVLTALLEDPGNYGRVVRDRQNLVARIVEARDADEKEKEIREINTGIYCVDNRFLFDAVKRIGNDNAQKEYYLTDMFEIARSEGRRVAAVITDEPQEAMGINTVEELRRAGEILEERAGKI